MKENVLVPKIRFKGFSGKWDDKTLNEISESIEYGLNAPAKEFDGHNKYLRITDIDDESRLFSTANLTTPNFDLSLAEKYRLTEREILFARTGASVGKTYIYKQIDGLVYYAGFLICARIGKAYSPEFIFSSTLTDSFNNFVKITSQRSGQPGINAQEYGNFIVMLPSKAEQSKIGIFFKSLDSLITLHQRKYDKLTTVKKAMLEKMFSKDDADVPEIRFKGFTENWERRQLEEITSKIGSGKTPKGGEAVYVLQGVPLIRSQNIYDNLVNLNNVVYINNKTHEEMENSTVNKNDVLLNITGASIGRSAVYRLNNKANVNQHVCIIRPNKSYSPDFIQLKLTAPEGQKCIDSTQAGGGREGLNFQQIAQISFSFPLIAEQKQIGFFFNHLDSLITLQQRELDKLKNIKKSCLEKMFI